MYKYNLKKVFFILSFEALFILLPLIVLFFNLLCESKIHSFFYTPDISLVSAVLLGQGLARIFSVHKKISSEAFLFFLAFGFVIGLAPALVIYINIFTKSQSSLPNLPFYLFVIQLIFFFFSCFLYFLFSGFAVTLPERLQQEENKPFPKKA